MKHVIAYFLVLSTILLAGCPYASYNANQGNANTNTNVAVSPTPVANLTPAEKSYEMPEFPFPPNASASYDVEMDWLKNPNGETTLEDVNKKLRRALSENGYQKLGYYSVKSINGGFVITTSLEQFQSDGTYLNGANRFTRQSEPPSIFSIYYWANVLRGNVGRYRLIAFMITDQLYEIKKEEPDIEAAENLALGGLNNLPPRMKTLVLTANHRCEALIYEFRKDRADGKIVFVRNSDVSADAHLRHLLKTLKGGV